MNGMEATCFVCPLRDGSHDLPARSALRQPNATAPATPAAAVAYASGWGDSKTILKWGMLILLIQMAIGLTLGSLLGSLLL